MTARPATQGREGRPALVMLHGFALDARMWRRQVDAFGGDHRMVLLDLPGFGPQARDVGEVEPAVEVARAMDAAGLMRGHLIASSYGASVAVDYALLYPGRVASLVLVAPMLLGRSPCIESWERCVALANEGDQQTAVEVWLDDPLFETLRRDEDVFHEVREIVLDYGGAHWTGKVTASFREPDPMSRLKDLAAPTLILSGEQDLPRFRLMAEAYARAMPRARREIVQGAGHHVSIEAPDAFNDLLRSFLRSFI